MLNLLPFKGDREVGLHMLWTRLGVVTAATFSFLVMPHLGAQEGFPLDGTWRGEWGDETGTPTHVVLVMKWNGETIDGQINPGPRSVAFDNAVLYPETWTVLIEATGTDGQAIAIEGRLENIGSYNRTIEGTWTEGGTGHPLKITRE